MLEKFFRIILNELLTLAREPFHELKEFDLAAVLVELVERLLQLLVGQFFAELFEQFAELVQVDEATVVFVVQVELLLQVAQVVQRDVHLRRHVHQLRLGHFVALEEDLVDLFVARLGASGVLAVIILVAAAVLGAAAEGAFDAAEEEDLSSTEERVGIVEALLRGPRGRGFEGSCGLFAPFFRAGAEPELGSVSITYYM